MKAESVIKPKKFTIDKIGEIAIISLFDNVKKVAKTIDGSTLNAYEYDYYQIKVPYRKGLEKEIEQNFTNWLQKAIHEEQSNEVRPPDIKNRVEMLEDTVNFLLGL